MKLLDKTILKRKNNLTNLTDEELIIKCKSGDAFSIEEIFSRYKFLLEKISRSYFLLGSDNDDLLQEAMIGLYKAILSFDKNQNTSFKTFAILCVRRNILSAIKKSNSKKNKVLNECLSLSDLTGDEEDNFLFLPSDPRLTDENMIEKEKLQEIKQQIVKTLSKLELKILNLYLKGFSYETMSKNLDVSRKSVDNALSRIKKKLEFLTKF